MVFNMGRIRGKDIKNVVFELYDAYEDKFSREFEHNKKIVTEMKLFESKKTRNRVAGYMVRVVRQSKK